MNLRIPTPPLNYNSPSEKKGKCYRWVRGGVGLQFLGVRHCETSQKYVCGGGHISPEYYQAHISLCDTNLPLSLHRQHSEELGLIGYISGVSFKFMSKHSLL